MAVGEGEDRLVLRRGHLAPREIGQALVRGQVAQRQQVDERLPAGVGAPGQRGRPAAGQDDQQVLGQLRQEGLAQPRVRVRDLTAIR